MANCRHCSSWALNSAVECHLHTVEVIGSNPIAPTTYETFGIVQHPFRLPICWIDAADELFSKTTIVFSPVYSIYFLASR